MFIYRRKEAEPIPGRLSPANTPPESPSTQPQEAEARSNLSAETGNQLAQPQDVTAEPPASAEIAPGELQKKYLERAGAYSAVLEQDRTKLKGSSVEEIRFDSQFLTEQQPEAEIDPKNLKAETLRRIAAYTDGEQNGWYVLNYQRMGNDANGFSHEINIGLGDILIDPDITEVQVKKADGTLIKGRRGVTPSGKHQGRIGFLDDNENYIVTYTGDSFRILTSEETNLETDEGKTAYIAKFKKENDIRTENRKTFQAVRVEGIDRERTPFIEQVTYKSDDTKIEGTDITVAVIKAAERESWQNQARRLSDLPKRENTAKLVNYVAREIGIPPELIYVTTFREVGGSFDPNYSGDGGKSLGWGHIQIPGWEKILADPRYHRVMSQVIEENPSNIERARSLLADIFGIAIKLKEGAEAIGITMDYTTQLTEQQLRDMRNYYHVPGYFMALRIGREAADAKYGKGYYDKAKAFIGTKERRYGRYAEQVIALRNTIRSSYPDSLA